MEQIVDTPARRGLPDFLPGQGSSSSSSRLRDDADEDFTGFFALFPVLKKVRSWARTRGRNCSPSRAHPPGELMRIGMLRGDGIGFRGLASLGPFVGAPAGSPGQVRYTGGTGSGAWHPLTPSWVPVRGASAPQIMEAVEVVQHVPTAGELILVCQCHRSCWYVEVACFHWCSSWTRLLTCLLRP